MMNRRDFLRKAAAATAVIGAGLPIAKGVLTATEVAAAPLMVTPHPSYFLVDPVNGVDGPLRTHAFKTIEAAIAEAEDNGGGTIYLTPGVHPIHHPPLVTKTTTIVGSPNGRSNIFFPDTERLPYGWREGSDYRPSAYPPLVRGAASAAALSYYL